MLLASGLTVSFMVAGISACRWLRSDRSDEVRLSLHFEIEIPGDASLILKHDHGGKARALDYG